MSLFIERVYETWCHKCHDRSLDRHSFNQEYAIAQLRRLGWAVNTKTRKATCPECRRGSK